MKTNWNCGEQYIVKPYSRLLNVNVNVWQKPLQYCKVISLQLMKINEKKKQLRVSSLSDRYRLFKRKSHTRKIPLIVLSWVLVGVLNYHLLNVIEY